MKALLAALLVTACSGAETSPGAGTASSDCHDLEVSARQTFATAVSESLACTGDADCVTVANAATCWDACTASVNKDRVPAIETARSQVNAAQCARFTEKSCPKPPAPPCVPPLPPQCKNGQCA